MIAHFEYYEDLGDLCCSPLPSGLSLPVTIQAWHSRSLNCHDCKVTWLGCWDNFKCSRCGNGEIPKPITGF